MSIIKISLAVLGPILALGLLIGALFFYYRNGRSRKRQAAKPSCKKHNHYQQQQLLETGMDPQSMPSGFLSNGNGGSNSCSGAVTTSYSHELRATAAGDSTLKVNSLIRKNVYIVCTNILILVCYRSTWKARA